MDNNTNSANSASGLLEIARERYTHWVGRAENGTSETMKRRTYLAMAAACADIISLYYQSQGDMEAGAPWSERSVRQYRRAMRKTNRIARNIGATMP